MSAKELFEKIRSDGFRLARMEWTYETVVNYAIEANGAPMDSIRVKGGSSNLIADNVAAFVDLRNAIDQLKNEYKDRVWKGDQLLEKIDNKEAASVIRLHYIFRLSWENVADLSHYSVRHVIRISENALKNMS